MRTREQQQLIDELMSTGRFDDAEAIVTAGLRLLKDVQSFDPIALDRLEQEIDKGLASGPATKMETSEDLIARFRKQM